MNQLQNLKKLIKNNTNLELEIKLGKFINTQFTADVNEIIFNKLIHLLNTNSKKTNNNNQNMNNNNQNTIPKIFNRSISCHKGEHRVELFLNDNNEIIQIEEINKKRIRNFDLPKNNMRITLSREDLVFKNIEPDISNLNKKITNNYSDIRCFRYKNRMSISHNNIWRFDFTKVYDTKDTTTLSRFLEEINKKNLKYRLELEIEYTGDYKDDLLKYIKDINHEIQPILNYKNIILKTIQNKLKNIEFKNIKKLNTTQWNSKQLMTSVQNLNHKTLNDIINSKTNYSVSEKADGERFLLYIYHNDIFKIDKSLNLNYVTNISKNNFINDNFIDNDLNSPTDLSKTLYLFDVEFISPNIYLIFDCLIFNGKDISSQQLDKRVSFIEKLYNKKNNFLNSLSKKLSIKIEIKKHHFSNKKSFFEICKKVYLDSKYKYDIDGLIFTPIEEQYRTNVYKWKPPEQQTIDFFIIFRHRNSVNKTKTELILDLYVTAPNRNFKYNRNTFKHINPKSKYIPYLFSKNNKIIVFNKGNKFIFKKNGEEIIINNKSIVEMSFLNGTWVPHKNRFDKDKQYNESIKKGIFDGPNALHIAKFIMGLIKKPITTEMITTGKIYFTGVNKKNSLISNMIKFNNQIKKQMYDSYLKKNMNLLELSAGRGGDFYRFLFKQPKFILFTNYAKDALQEAQRRFHLIKKDSKEELNETSIIFQEYDLREDVTKDMKPLIDSKQFDVVSCQFAIHYFMESENVFLNFFKNVDSYIKKHGVFMFTCFDGLKIRRLLDTIAKNEKMEFKIKGEITMSLTRIYDKRNKKPFGNKISVFSQTIGEHEEYLVDLEYIIKYFEKKHYKLIENVSFGDLVNKFNGKLSETEIKFTSLYNKLVLQKI